jgi:hypothetical protein
MSFQLAYWVLMGLWFAFGLWSAWPLTTDPAKRTAAASELFLFILLVLLGWKIFGPPVHA